MSYFFLAFDARLVSCVLFCINHFVHFSERYGKEIEKVDGSEFVA